MRIKFSTLLLQVNCICRVYRFESIGGDFEDVIAPQFGVL